MVQHERIETICSTQRMDLVITIVSRGKGEAVLDVFRRNNILQNVICHGHGTAPSSILEMLGLGALGSMMTGSGTAVFGIFDSVQTAVKGTEAVNHGFHLCAHSVVIKGCCKDNHV